MATVVVCDDDPVVRGAITTVCEEAGLEVVAETDSGIDAVELVRRFEVDILILDLSLVHGSGERTLEALHSEQLDVAVVVFTAFAADPSRLLRLGANEVVDKPDLERLGAVLARLGPIVDGRTEDNPDERRTSSRGVEGAPSIWRSPSGVSSADDLAPSLLTLAEGDAVLGVTIRGLEAIEATVGTLLATDCRLAVARILREQLRIQDLLHDAPRVDGFVALLRGGDGRAVDAVWARLTSAVAKAGVPGELHGAGCRVGAMGGADAVARADKALHTSPTAGASFVTV